MNIPRFLQFKPYRLISLGTFVISGGWILMGPTPWVAKVPVLLTLGLWAFLGARAGVLLPLVAGLVALADASPGALPGMSEHPEVLWAVTLAMAGLSLRLWRGDAASALGAGLLWGGSAVLVPGLAPLALTGLFAMAALQSDHGRKVVFPGLVLMGGALAYSLMAGGPLAELMRPTHLETYRELGAMFQALFQRESILWVIVLVGLFEPAMVHPSHTGRFLRQLPFFGMILCLGFLPVELIPGVLFYAGLPVSSLMLTRWILALPGPSRRFDSPLGPSAHELPDNVWHTLLTAGLAGACLWMSWQQGLESFRTGVPLTTMEEIILAEEGAHPIYASLQEVTDPAVVPEQFWNRLLSGLGVLLLAGMLLAMLWRMVGPPRALVSMALLFAFPGLGQAWVTAGSGVFGAVFYLMAYSALNLKEDALAWLRGGLWAGLAFWIDPLWGLPVIGLMIGVLEVHRPRLSRGLLGLGGGLVAGLLFVVLVDPSWLGRMLPSALSPEQRVEGVWAILPVRHPFLLVALVLIVGCGVFRRGLGWWSLMLALPAAFMAGLLAAEPGTALIPLLVAGTLGFARLPALMDLRHSGPCQTVVTCQLMLWLPVYLGAQSPLFFP